MTLTGLPTLHTTTVSDTLDTEKTSMDSAGNVYYRWKYLLPQKYPYPNTTYPDGSLKTRIEAHRNGTLVKKYLSSGMITDSVFKPWPGMRERPLKPKRSGKARKAAEHR